MKGIIPFIWLGIIAVSLVGATGIPVAYDNFMGNNTMPDNALYGLEVAGENIRCAFSTDKPACFMELSRERETEHAYIQDRLKGMSGEMRERYQNMAQEMVMRAEEYRDIASLNKGG